MYHSQAFPTYLSSYILLSLSLLQTTSAGDSKAEAPEEKKGGGMFCGMSLTEALILLVILGLFIFFVVSTIAHSLI